MPANAIRILPEECDREELQAFQARVVKLRARVFEHNLSKAELKERVARARQMLAATRHQRHPQNQRFHSHSS